LQLTPLLWGWLRESLDSYRLTGFRNPGDKNELSWPAQAGATLYEIARSGVRDFSSDCWVTSTQQIYSIDTDDPGSGSLFYYLVRALAPYAGSWGMASSDVERLPQGTRI
jgi:hypothetical protein